MRHAAVLLHRYTGLGLAAFLVLVGLTGAAIAWNDELERVFAPSMFVLPAVDEARPALDALALRDAAARAAPGFAVNGVGFTRERDEPARFYIEALPGGPEAPNDEIALDPATGFVTGMRRHGDLRQGTINLMPFIYDLHDSLALGDTGSFILGFVALLWTVDCFIGAYLTFPARWAHPRRPTHWAKRWSRAWKFRWPTTSFKFTFDLHSAGGLWLWGLLLILAWSSVAFNLPAVYQPVTRMLFGSEASPPPRPLSAVTGAPKLGWREAHEAAIRAMAEEARRYGFSVKSERLMFYNPAARTYAYRVRSSLDVGRYGNTQITIDADDGHRLSVTRPTGAGTGATVTTWIEDIHTAGVFGRPMQIVITITGLGVALLSITGVLIYLRKRRARLA